MPEWEIEEAKSFCAERNIRQLIFELDPLVIEEFRINKPDRCYACKRRIFSEIELDIFCFYFFYVGFIHEFSFLCFIMNKKNAFVS